MEFTTPAIRFSGATPYTFYYEHAQLVLLTWTRDDAKFLFRVQEQSDGEWVLDYPGETFSSHVLDAIQTIFFVQVVEDSDDEPKPYVLGSCFEFQGQDYGAYYPRHATQSEMLLFRFAGEAPMRTLESLEGDEYQQVSAHFVEQYA